MREKAVKYKSPGIKYLTPMRFIGKYFHKQILTSKKAIQGNIHKHYKCYVQTQNKRQGLEYYLLLVRVSVDCFYYQSLKLISHHSWCRLRIRFSRCHTKFFHKIPSNKTFINPTHKNFLTTLCMCYSTGKKKPVDHKQKLNFHLIH